MSLGPEIFFFLFYPKSVFFPKKTLKILQNIIIKISPEFKFFLHCKFYDLNMQCVKI